MSEETYGADYVASAYAMSRLTSSVMKQALTAELVLSVRNLWMAIYLQ